MELLDEDKEEVRLHESISALPSTSGEKSKKEPMTVEELDEQIQKQMRDEIKLRLREAKELNAAKMASLQESMERQWIEEAQRHADLMA